MLWKDLSEQFIGFKISIRHIHNYTEYNQQWNVSQVRFMDSVIICNTNTREYTEMEETHQHHRVEVVLH